MKPLFLAAKQKVLPAGTRVFWTAALRGGTPSQDLVPLRLRAQGRAGRAA